MPARGNFYVRSFPTPEIADVLLSQVLDFGTADNVVTYGDTCKHKDYLTHTVVAIEPVPESGYEHFRVWYAADRSDQDNYNFSHSHVGIGGVQYESVTRTYIIPRSSYDPDSPAHGATMPDVPASQFGGTYRLASKSQGRISERTVRGHSSPQLDSKYIVETRVYIKDVTLTTSSYDDATNGLLFTNRKLWFRGDSYSNAIDSNPVNIETAVADSGYWGVSSTGIKITFDQLNSEVWVVTEQDMISQDLDGTGNVYGGTVVRTYETKTQYNWPSVLGDDGSTNMTASGVEIMDWELKEGGTRNYPRVGYSKIGGSYNCRTTIHEEYLTPTQLAAADGAAGSLDNIDNLFPARVVYPSPWVPINIPPCLHPSVVFVSDTGANDPTFDENTGSSRTFPATAETDWPASLVIDSPVVPWRGGYLARRVTVYEPS